MIRERVARLLQRLPDFIALNYGNERALFPVLFSACSDYASFFGQFLIRGKGGGGGGLEY